MFTRTVYAYNTADRDLMTLKMNDGLYYPYDFGWDDGVFHADLYFEEHLTRSGGWFGEQRTVNACVRYSDPREGPTMASIDCPEKSPYNLTVDEHVTVP